MFEKSKTEGKDHGYSSEHVQILAKPLRMVVQHARARTELRRCRGRRARQSVLQRMIAFSSRKGAVRGLYYGAASGAAAALLLYGGFVVGSWHEGLESLWLLVILAMCGAIVGLVVGVVAGLVLGLAIGVLRVASGISDVAYTRAVTVGCALVAALPAVYGALSREWSPAWFAPIVAIVAAASYRHAHLVLRYRDRDPVSPIPTTPAKMGGDFRTII